MKKLEIKSSDSPFNQFYTSRFGMSSRIDAQKLYDFSKENDLSFFIMSLGCLISALNSVPALKRKNIDGESFEFEKIDGITPLLNKEGNMYEMRVYPPEELGNLKKWYYETMDLQESIYNGSVASFSIPMNLRDLEPIANFSCIPWVDFDSITSAIAEPHQIQPLVTWGKLVHGKMSVAITVSHIFVYGYDLGLFYKSANDFFQNFKF